MQLIISIIHMCKLWTVSGTNEPTVLKGTAEFGCLQSSDTTKCGDATSSVILHYSPPPFHLKCDWLLNKCADMSAPMCQRRAHTHTHEEKKTREDSERLLILHVTPERRKSTGVDHMFFKTTFRVHKRWKKQRRRFKIQRSVLDSQSD